MKKCVSFLLLILLLMFLSSCNRAPAAIASPGPPMAEETPVVAGTPTMTATTTAVITAKPTITPTTTPTTVVTIVPTETMTPEATVTPTKKAATQTKKSSTPSRSPSPAPTPTSTPTPIPTQTTAQPVLLEKMAAKQGQNLEQLNCQQLVLVVANGSQCALYTYARENEIWKPVMETTGYVGKNGVTDDMFEGAKKTPLGIYALGFAFGHDTDPTTNYPYRRITPDSYWVDDPDSAYYNQWVNGTTEKDWDSAEILGEIRPAYDLALVVEYNYGGDTVPGKGSAIFVHVGNKPTSGCIAIPKSDLKELLGWLDEAKTPHIIISEE